MAGAVPGVRPLMLVDGKIFIPDTAFEWQFLQAAGPGGQNVNKVSSAVRLSFDFGNSIWVPDEIRARWLAKFGGPRVVVCARNERSQYLNRREAVEKMAEILANALRVPRKRHATKPTAGSVRRRLEGKAHRSTVKRDRNGSWEEE